MDLQRLGKIKRELLEMRKSPAGRKASEFEGYARKLGRAKANRGKEPTWTKAIDPSLSPPLSIPNHNRDLKPGTARCIIDQLLADCDEWDQYLLLQQDNEHED